MKKTTALPQTVFKIILGLLLFCSACFWASRASVFLNRTDDYKFSSNTFSGVHLSRDTDARAPNGRISGTNAYASFLAEATALVSSVRGGNVFFDQERYLDSEAVSGLPLIRAHILPISSGNQFFGIQARTKLKLSRVVGSFKGLKNRWAYLINRSNHRYLVYLEGIDDESVASVRGDLPFGFIPTEIYITPIVKQSQPAFFQLYTDLTHVVRGGVVTASRPTVMLRNLPYIAKIPFSQRFSYLPVVGDIITFHSGEHRTVMSVTHIEGALFVELDSAIAPYMFSNNDIVTIKQSKQESEGKSKIIVSQVTDEDFFLGRERYLRINADLKMNTPHQGDYVSGDHGGAQYYIASANESGMTLDLFQSKRLELCKKIRAESSKFSFTLAVSDGLIDSALNKSIIACDLGTAGYEVVTKLFTAISDGRSIDNKIIKLFDRIDDNERMVSLSEIYNRALDMELVYTCKSCGKNVQLNERYAMPHVAGQGDVWETYPGSMLNIYYGSLNPAPQELLIHALGSELSAAYYKRFSVVQPSFVALANPRQFTPWLYNWHWPYFELLLLNYNNYYLNSDFSIWYRPDAGWRELNSKWDGFINLEGNLNEPEQEVNLPIIVGDGLSLYTVEVEYEVKNQLSSLPVIGTSPRLLIYASGTGADFPARPPVSLPLKDKRFTFPLIIKGAESNPKLKVKLIDPFSIGASYEIKTVKWRRVAVDSSKIEALFNYAPAYKFLASEINKSTP